MEKLTAWSNLVLDFAKDGILRWLSKISIFWTQESYDITIDLISGQVQQLN